MLVVKEEDGNKEMGNHMLLVIVHIETEKGFFGILKRIGEGSNFLLDGRSMMIYNK